MRTEPGATTAHVSNDIFDSLDLGFSDGYATKGQNVRMDTIANHEEDLKSAIALMHTEEAINFSLWNAFGPDHPSPQIYALDFPSDLRASLYVLLGGYYRQAILCLRNWLEMRLLGIYFGRVDDSRYADWKAGGIGKDDGLFGTGLVKGVFARAEFHKADARNGLRGHLLDLYGQLSVFAHGQGLEKHGLQDDTDNVPRYNRRSVDLHLRLLKETFGEIVYCFWLAYAGDALRDLEPEQAHTIAGTLRAAYVVEMLPHLVKVAPDLQ